MPPMRRTLATFALLTLALTATLVPTFNCPALDSPVVVSVHQGPSQPGNFEANLATCRTVISNALGRGSHFLAFPQGFLSGGQTPHAVQQGSRPLDDPALRAFITESATHPLVVLAGLARKSGNRTFDSILVIHQGRLLGVHDRVLLTPADRDQLGFSPGTDSPVFEAHGVRFAALAGTDIDQPHLALAAKLQGAEIVFSLQHETADTPLADDRIRHSRNLHTGLASVLQVAIARANTVVTDVPGRLGCGDSLIVGPQGQPLGEAGLFRTELLTTLLSPLLFQPPQTRNQPHDTPGWLRSAVADLLAAHRPAASENSLRDWLENMAVHHRFSPDEMGAVTGLDRAALDEALIRWNLTDPQPPAVQPDAPVRVLPYPGGRHPRLGFFDGARNPHRETKVSVFPPWPDGGYAVVDVPEAIFSNLGLIYLAHTHIPTVWDQRGIELPRLEWSRSPTGALVHERTLPNGIAFGAEVLPTVQGVQMKLWLRNGTPERLTGLRVQNCVMLGRTTGFTTQSLANKVFHGPFAAARSADGHRWIITAWQHCGRAWGNDLVPCIHSDPVFPDCPPGETVRLAGWLSFHQGPDVRAEFDRLARLGIPATP